MQKISNISGVAAPLDLRNVDTDMIIPSQYLKTVSRQGLGKFAFYNVRHDAAGKRVDDFVLNRAPFEGAPVLIAGENFGCGSSREHAVWALMEIGIRCVIAPSFGQIFALNAVHNGLLLIALPQAMVEDLMEKASRGANAIFHVDLDAQEITDPEGNRVRFHVDERTKSYLMEGSSDSVFIRQRHGAIAAFEQRQRTEQPWVWRQRGGAQPKPEAGS